MRLLLEQYVSKRTDTLPPISRESWCPNCGRQGRDLPNGGYLRGPRIYRTVDTAKYFSLLWWYVIPSIRRLCAAMRSLDAIIWRGRSEADQYDWIRFK